MQTQYGVYSDDFVTFGTFDKEAVNLLDDEEVLLKIISEDSGEHSVALDKTTLKFENNEILFSKEVHPEKGDVEVNHAIEETQLDQVSDES
jgi:hypothetical protein